MFLRRNRSEVDGAHYEYWNLVESYRTERGPRQRVVATLGKLPGLDEEERHGWEEIGALLEGRVPARQLKLGQSAAVSQDQSAPRWAEVNLRGVRVERVRDFEEVYLALSSALQKKVKIFRKIANAGGPSSLKPITRTYEYPTHYQHPPYHRPSGPRDRRPCRRQRRPGQRSPGMERNL